MVNPPVDKSQCTFWCSVLSDMRTKAGKAKAAELGLNAPFGAQCFPTNALSAVTAFMNGSQCTFWCSVLSDPQDTYHPG